MTSLDLAELGMCGGALVAVLGASWKVFSVAVGIGRLVQKSEDSERAIALIPGLALEVTSIKSMVSQNVTITAAHQIRLDEYHSDIRQLRQDVAVNQAIREHSQGDYR